MDIDNSEVLLLDIKDLIESSDTVRIKEILLKIMNYLLSDFTNLLYKKPIRRYQDIVIEDVDDSIRVNYGTKTSTDILFLGKWLFDFPKMVKESLVLFIIIKECFSQFIPSQKKYFEANEFILNIISILWLKESFSIRSIDSRIIADIRSKIFPTEIAGKADIFWDSLLNLLFANNISFSAIFEAYNNIIESAIKNNYDQDTLVNEFYTWIIEKTVTPKEVIAPIFLTVKLFNIVDLLHNLGYEEGTSGNIASSLNVHQNTIRNAFSHLLSYFATYWRPIINYEKMNLHNYFFTLELNSPDFLELVSKELDSIPYLKSLYHGKNAAGKTVLYSPTLICPHYISDMVNKKFKMWETKGYLDSFYLQLMRSRKIYHAITTTPFNSSLKNYEKLLRGKKVENIKKYLLTNEIVDFSTEFNAENPAFDYNILYFLSILKNKFLLKARYGVLINELPELYKKNNIDSTDVNTQTDFINQLEIRARRRELLTYSLYVSSFKKGSSEVLLLEVPTTIGKEELFNQVIDKIRIFSLLAEITLYDRWLLTLPGLTHDHKIAEILIDVFQEAGFEVKPYTIQLMKSKMVPLHELYDFEEKKWFLGLE